MFCTISNLQEYESLHLQKGNHTSLKAQINIQPTKMNPHSIAESTPNITVPSPTASAESYMLGPLYRMANADDISNKKTSDGNSAER
jgi:hypothetical protein